MAPIKPLRKFACTIAELYAICRFCWNSCLTNIADFTAYKTFYDEAYAEAALTEIDTVEDMPGEQERNLISEAIRVQLLQASQTCLAKWRALRGYIRSSFAAEYVEMNIEAAGGNYYEAAYHESWEDVQMLMNTGSGYIAENTAALTAGGMPAGFAAGFNAAFTAYSPLFGNYKDAEMDAEAGTIEKMVANNTLYDKVQAMNADGQTIYEDDPTKYSRFVFQRVKDLLNPPGNAIPATSFVLKGNVVSNANGQPLVNASVTVGAVGDPNPGVTVTTNAAGDYYFRADGLEAGSSIAIHIAVAAPGFETFTKDITITVGQSFTENVAMLPVVMQPA